MTRRRSPIVLHVDDSAEVRRSIAGVLSRNGFAVVDAESGAEGLAAAARVRPDLVLLDIDLPDISGLRVCERLRGNPRTRRIPVLHLSGARVGVDDRVQGLEGGADAYLTHPVDPAELVATVRALIRVRLAEERERRAQRRARSAGRARDDAVAMVSQVLGPHLTAFGINLEGVLAALPAGDAVATTRGAALREAARAAARALADLADLARLEAGRAPTAIGSTEAAPVVAEVLSRLGARAERRAILLRSRISPTDLRVRCEAARLDQLLSALVGDAVAAGTAGSAVEITVSPDGPDVAVTVRHRHGGSRRAVLAAFSGPFWDPARGRGSAEALPLAIARAIVAVHGGQVWAEDHDGVASVELVLPGGPAPA